MAFERKTWMKQYNQSPERRAANNAAAKKYRAKIASTEAGLKKWRDDKRAYNATEQGKRNNRNRVLRFQYGITIEEYDVLANAQGNCCAICGRNSSADQYGVLHVDHDHKTGAVRGLLCGRCNRGLGQFEDVPERLEKAVTYLKGFTDAG